MTSLSSCTGELLAGVDDMSLRGCGQAATVPALVFSGHRTTVDALGRSEHRLSAEGREDAPTAYVIDSQSIKISTHRPRQRAGYRRGGKKIVGRKQSIAIDTVGLLLGVLDTAASRQDFIAGQGAGAPPQGRRRRRRRRRRSCRRSDRSRPWPYRASPRSRQRCSVPADAS
ncbi:transposase, partial [Streptomyces sp. SAS_267]|uniref:transposase n=1 Tax=Streptomyces sp. SAS_267 TaxID=3412750 RepID=UPI00403CE298